MTWTLIALLTHFNPNGILCNSDHGSESSLQPWNQNATLHPKPHTYITHIYIYIKGFIFGVERKLYFALCKFLSFSANLYFDFFSVYLVYFVVKVSFLLLFFFFPICFHEAPIFISEKWSGSGGPRADSDGGWGLPLYISPMYCLSQQCSQEVMMRMNL